MTRWLIACVALALLALASEAAHADQLSPVEAARLGAGESVSRVQSLDRDGRHYVGGIAYSIVDAPADDVALLLTRVEGWSRIVPKTRSAQRVGQIAGDTLIEITHGTTLLRAAYTLRVHRDGREMRFWMDRQRPHDIEDAWGFFRAEPWPDGRSLVTFGVLIDIGDGLVRDLFEGRVLRAALTVPERVQGLVLERLGAGARASR